MKTLMLGIGGASGTDLCSQLTQILKDPNIILLKKGLNNIRFQRLTSDIPVIHLFPQIRNRTKKKIKSPQGLKIDSSRLEKWY